MGPLSKKIPFRPAGPSILQGTGGGSGQSRRDLSSNRGRGEAACDYPYRELRHNRGGAGFERFRLLVDFNRSVFLLSGLATVVRNAAIFTCSRHTLSTQAG